ncbi:MAG: tyrosine-type recombinase/integrase [Candidatus Nanohaloarchaea archaeon]
MQNAAQEDLDLNIQNQSFTQNSNISAANKRAVQKFVDKCYAEGLSEKRVQKYVTNFNTILERYAFQGFELSSADKEELERVVASIERSDYSHATKSDFKTALKKYYKVMECDGYEYPDKVRFIDTTRDKSKEDNPDPLTKEEIDEIIDQFKNDRDRAMYKVLYEGGLRSGELVDLTVGDVNFVDEGVRLTVNGKTGERTILLVESERYLRNWLQKHPYPNRRDAPLWTLIDGIEDKSMEELKVSYDYMRISLKRKARDAGIRVTQKNHGKSSEVYPYLFRHSRATHLATELTEAAMKQYFGWTQNSDMPKTYIHLSGRDLDGEIMDMYGVEKNEEEPEKKECTRCTKTYKGEDRFCPRCGAPFNAVTAQKKDEVEEAAETIARKIVNGEIDREKVEEMAGAL